MTSARGWIYWGQVIYWGLIKDYYRCQHTTEQRPLKVEAKQISETFDLHRNTRVILQSNPVTVLKEAKWALRHALCWKYPSTQSFKCDGKKEWNIDLALCDPQWQANPASI